MRIVNNFILDMREVSESIPNESKRLITKWRDERHFVKRELTDEFVAGFECAVSLMVKELKRVNKDDILYDE